MAVQVQLTRSSSPSQHRRRQMQPQGCQLRPRLCRASPTPWQLLRLGLRRGFGNPTALLLRKARFNSCRLT